MVKKNGRKTIKKESASDKVEVEVKELVTEVSNESKKGFKLYLEKTKNILFNSNSFLNSIEHEKSYQQVLAFFVVTYLVYFILSYSLGLISLKYELVNYFVDISKEFVIAVIFSVLYPFAFSGIVHLGTLIFRGKESFFNTFKPSTYSLFIWVFYITLILIITTIINLIVPFETSMINNLPNDSSQEVVGIAYQQFFNQPGAFYFLIVFIVLMIAGMIHQMIFLTKGISKFQKITKLKAFLSIIIIPIFFFIMIILSFVLLSLI